MADLPEPKFNAPDIASVKGNGGGQLVGVDVDGPVGGVGGDRGLDIAPSVDTVDCKYRAHPHYGTGQASGRWWCRHK